MAKSENKPSLELTEFANALQDWAAQGPAQEQRQRETLLKWLLSRCESRGFRGPCKSRGSKGPEEEDKYVIKRIDIEDIKIKEAVMRAMADYNPDLPTSGWIRGGPIWPKAYGDIWPRAYGDIWPRAYG
jgi:hypothetical protein